jgi:hypothetical protein
LTIVRGIRYEFKIGGGDEAEEPDDDPVLVVEAV